MCILGVFFRSNETCPWRASNLMFLLTIFNRDRTKGSYWKRLVILRAKLIPELDGGKNEDKLVGKGHYLQLLIHSNCVIW